MFHALQREPDAYALPAARSAAPHARPSRTAQQGGNAMSLFSHRNAAPLWKVWPILTLSLVFTACALSDADTGKVKKLQPDEPRKVGSGRSFVEQTRIEVAPIPAAAPGWFSEAAASGQDDWEPAVAVDPAAANFVYQLVTRYTGPKPCGNCKLPEIGRASCRERVATRATAAASRKTEAYARVEVNAND